VINHEELLVQISKTVSRIADVLPRAELASSLYQTDRMNRTVAQLYVKIMRFVQDAVRWYKMGKIKHSLTSITRPYDLSFKDLVEEIAEASRNVDKEASAASRAEIRGLHLQVIHLTEISKSKFSVLKRDFHCSSSLYSELRPPTFDVDNHFKSSSRPITMASALANDRDSVIEDNRQLT
jgi:hypothetical protein